MSPVFLFRRLPLFPRLALAALAASATLPAAAPKEGWPAIPPAEVQATQCETEPDAAAEVMEWTIYWDSEKEGRYDEYIRIKIYDPSRVESLTREEAPVAEKPFVSTLTARHTLPDGTSRVIEDRECQVRTARKTSADETKQKFLAVGGVVAGSIVEFRKTRDRGQLSSVSMSYGGTGSFADATVLQISDAPVRRFEARWLIPPPERRDSRLFVVNAPGATVQNGKKELRVLATNLPSLRREPHTGPRTDYAATLVWSSVATVIRNFAPYAKASSETRDVAHTRVTKNNQGWAPYATFVALMDEQQGQPTPGLRKFAAELGAGAASELEKARRIHGHVQKLYQAYRSQTRTLKRFSDLGKLTSLDLLLDAEKSAGLISVPTDYFWLAVALYRAAGFDATVAMLPNRELARFQRDQVATVFLPNWCVVVKIGDATHFSYPLQYPALFTAPGFYSRSYLQFGHVPWSASGQLALLAIADEEKFIPVTPTPPEQSKTTTIGVFQLDDAGNLRGQARRQITGQSAAQLRSEFSEEPEQKQKEAVLAVLRRHAEGAEIELTKLTGFDDSEKPIEAEFKLSWPGFAVSTSDRLILRPSVFWREVPAKFTADNRRAPIHFPFPYEQTDNIGIQVPSGFVPESLPAVGGQPGKSLSHTVRFGFDERRRLLTLRRDFLSAILDVPANAYPQLKEWFSVMAAVDQQEVVLTRATAASAAPAASAASAPTAAAAAQP